MNTPQDTSTSLHNPSTPAIARLVDTAGRDGPATPRDVASQLQSGGFFWLDLRPGEGTREPRLPAGQPGLPTILQAEISPVTVP